MTVSGVTPHEDYLWLGRIPNNVLNLKGGDKVHARAEFLREEGKKHLKLKKTGLCLEREFMREDYKIEWESKPYTYPATDDDAWPSKHSHNLIRKTRRLSRPGIVDFSQGPSSTLFKWRLGGGFLLSSLFYKYVCFII
ncbi:unnamed protein product [Prunus armeniaca]|uniref:Uncharacterized protein n=1 Tax=Prunus armeniaca TaxID=36596 RepID=A0A6J5W8K6_PRUAR|nr:unnamed protein product [Prunus armeniaca]